jgi:hypothetical protein
MLPSVSRVIICLTAHARITFTVIWKRGSRIRSSDYFTTSLEILTPCRLYLLERRSANVEGYRLSLPFSFASLSRLTCRRLLSCSVIAVTNFTYLGVLRSHCSIGKSYHCCATARRRSLQANRSYQSYLELEQSLPVRCKLVCMLKPVSTLRPASISSTSEARHRSRDRIYRRIKFGQAPNWRQHEPARDTFGRLGAS